MGAITDLSMIVNKLTGGDNGNPQHPAFWFGDRAAGAALTNAYVAGQLTSLWRMDKTNGALGIAPTTTSINPTNTTAGALPIANPTGGRQLWLLGMEMCGSFSGTLMLYDRLMQTGQLSANSTGPQGITGGTITRNTGGEGNEIWIELQSAIGSTATTITASYTNQAGTAGQTTRAVAIGSASGSGLQEHNRILRLPLAAGDTGVQSVQSITFAAATGAGAGAVAVVIARPIAMGHMDAAGAASIRDFITGLPSIPEIPSSACLAFAILSAQTFASTGARGYVQLHMIEA